ncbi:MAG: NAD-dependent epimerase/dehydratase family protein [Armatimonadota bacterium]
MKPKAIVAGGAGFLGSHMTMSLLEHDYHVIVVDNYETGSRRNARDLRELGAEVIEHDICEPLHVAGEIDCIINMACPASPVDFDRLPLQIMRTCSLGTENLLNLARIHDAVFLQASTSEVYGDPEIHPQKEEYCGNVNIAGPRAVYDEGKRYAETLCHTFRRHYDTRVRIVRIFNTYGPRMRPDDGRVVSNFMTQALSDEALTLYGGGEQTRSFCYCSDLIRGIFALLNSEYTEPVNLGNPTEISIRELAEIVLEITGSDSELKTVPALHDDDPKRRRPEITRAREVLGWTPSVDLREGLMKALPWFKGFVDS